MTVPWCLEMDETPDEDMQQFRAVLLLHSR
jgi:hypothetical protein